MSGCRDPPWRGVTASDITSLSTAPRRSSALFSALFLEITYGSVPLVGLFFGRMVPRAVTTALVGYALLRLMTSKNVLAWMRRRELQKEL